MDSNKNLSKNCFKFYCEKCDYGTCKKSSYNDHLLSAKHVKSMNINQNLPKICSEYICQNCSKKYKDNSGLWRHKKKCNKQFSENDSDNNNKNLTDKDLIMMLINENKEFKQIILDQNKTILELSKNNTNITNNTNNTNNSHNKTFNMQIFLNEECKDALNISEFVSSIKVQLEDLETTGRLGYVEGVSRIINKNLNEFK
jgi:hypothetical protein